ncbi:hypothetical protein L211DRAFT_836059 [Terfezia boudieri ATCC MYA-4762]|uniref:Uncharacterized protein n=1 Tax=Terfezia boudieri ATCC MYA-4762 TaxID=1051890 RepID=A0A3N4LST4_9PEZI|nr:hypothetical protein L211DRAFT_836059 [Terfezia boudieri ATCC MYA-4762]
MPTDRDTGKRRGTTILERVRIIESNALGFSQRDIALKTTISKTTVQRLLKRWKTTQQAGTRTTQWSPRNSDY